MAQAIFERFQGFGGIFFAVIGASANVLVVMRVGPVLFVFAALILTIHLLFLLGSGWLLRLDLSEIVIASNANMGGPTTAAAMAAVASTRWPGGPTTRTENWRGSDGGSSSVPREARPPRPSTTRTTEIATTARKTAASTLMPLARPSRPSPTTS